MLTNAKTRAAEGHFLNIDFTHHHAQIALTYFLQGLAAICATQSFAVLDPASLDENLLIQRDDNHQVINHNSSQSGEFLAPTAIVADSDCDPC